MSAFAYRPDPLDDMPARAAAVLPDMALLPMLARRIQVARRSGPLHPQLSFDIDKLIEGVDAALDLAEVGHESEAFDRSLAHLRQLARSIDSRLGARFAAAAADLEMQAGVSVQDLGTAPQDATPAWAALAGLPAPTTPGSLGDAAPPVILRTGFDDNDCGRVSGSFHVLDARETSPVAPAQSVVVPADTYVRFEPGQVFILHVAGWQPGGRTNYPEKKGPRRLRLLSGDTKGALVHGPAVIQHTQEDGKPILQRKALEEQDHSRQSSRALDVSLVSALVCGTLASAALMLVDPVFSSVMLNVVSFIFLAIVLSCVSFVFFGMFALKIVELEGRSSGANFIPPARAEAMPGTRALRVLEPLKALPAPDPVTEDTKVVQLEPARR